MNGKLVGFVPTADAERARHFYETALGLRFVSLDNFALVLESNGNHIRVTIAGAFKPAPYTILGWEVSDIEARVKELAERGVLFLRFDFLPQDPLGIWTTPDGSRVAWMNDPDGNVLSLSQHSPAGGSSV